MGTHLEKSETHFKAHTKSNTILLGASPDHSIIGAAEQEADRHDRQIVVHILQQTQTDTCELMIYAIS